jgi:xylulokinase
MFAGIPDRYSLETVILGGTYTIDWFLDNFSGGQNIEQLEKDIQDLPPGSQGLMLVPYWSSALNPYWNSRASGIVVGWRGRHQPRHLFRAVLEGIAFELRLHFEGVRAALEADINALVVTGGGSHSDNWCQIIADVTGKTVQRSTTSEATALGAGIIAACGVGLFDDFRSAASAMKGPIQDRFTPDSKRHQQYSNLFEQVYKELYPAIQSQLNNLADLSEVY